MFSPEWNQILQLKLDVLRWRLYELVQTPAAHLRYFFYCSTTAQKNANPKDTLYK